MRKNIIPGVSLEKFYPELDNCGLVCVTEVSQKRGIDRFAEILTDILAT